VGLSSGFMPVFRPNAREIGCKRGGIAIIPPVRAGPALPRQRPLCYAGVTTAASHAPPRFCPERTRFPAEPVAHLCHARHTAGHAPVPLSIIAISRNILFAMESFPLI